MKLLSSHKLPPHQPLKNRRAAFTLVELLVVVAIIAILAAILFPVFARARENARRSSCSSNLKQLGLGLRQYAQDYDGRVIIGDVTGHYNGQMNQRFRHVLWMDVVYPYVKSEQIFNCPSEGKTHLPGGQQPWQSPGGERAHQ